MERTIFANGCFDLLHAGHLSLLEYCSTLGRVLVGVNSDASVKRLKGQNRPITPQEERVYALQSCRFVSEVHIFDEDTPLELIMMLKPDVIVKGAEYKGMAVIGQDFAKVALFEPVFESSTTGIIERIRKAYA